MNKEERKRLRQRSDSSCKDEVVSSGEQVSLLLTGCHYAPAMTQAATCTPTQGKCEAVSREHIPYPTPTLSHPQMAPDAPQSGCLAHRLTYKHAHMP